MGSNNFMVKEDFDYNILSNYALKFSKIFSILFTNISGISFKHSINYKEFAWSDGGYTWNGFKNQQKGNKNQASSFTAWATI